MTATTHAARAAAVRAHLEALGQWARRGRVRALVTKLVLTVGGVATLLLGLAMLVLPGAATRSCRRAAPPDARPPPGSWQVR